MKRLLSFAICAAFVAFLIFAPAKATEIGAGAGPVVQLGGSFSTGSTGTTGVTTVLSASSNANGCYLRSAAVSSTGGGLAELYLSTAAPSAVDATTGPYAVGAYGTDVEEVPAPLWLPAGTGIYFAYSASSSTGRWSVTWDCR